MDSKLAKLAMLLVMAALLAYCVYNYLTRKTGLPLLVASVLILGYHMLRIGASLIQDLKNKE